LVIGWPWLSCH